MLCAGLRRRPLERRPEERRKRIRMPTRIQTFYSTPCKRGDDGREYELSATSLRQIEAQVLYQLVAKSGAVKTLEIGLALGASAVAIADALSCQPKEHCHVVLDPYQHHFGNVGLLELERLGLRQRVEFHQMSSEDFLHDASKNGARFDLIFNDGSHMFGSKVTSAFLGDRCLRVGGIFAFHDAFKRSTTACVRYLVGECGYKPVSLQPDSIFKRWARSVKYIAIHGAWYAIKIIPTTCCSLVALQKTGEAPKDA